MRRRDWLAAGAAAPLLTLAGAASGKAGERVLRIAFPTAESTFDPPQTNSDFYASTVLANILEAPLSYDYLARPMRLVPATAEDLPTVSADARVITLTIRRGIYFADDPAFKGVQRELVAQDYVYAIKRFFDPRYNSADLYLFEGVGLRGLAAVRTRAIKTRQPFNYDLETEGCRALDRYTLRLQLDKPDPRFVYTLATPALTGAVAREVVEHYGADVGAHPVGTGAFRLAYWRRASRIELARSPSFRHTVYEGQVADDPHAQAIAKSLRGRTLPLVDRVHIDIVEESQPRWLAFLQGRYDWLDVPAPFARLAVPNGQLAPYLARMGMRLQLAPQASMAMNYFNMEHALVGGYTPERVALRRAIALSYDGEADLRIARGGLAIAAQSPIPPFTSGYDASYRSTMSEFDPARAKALLDMHGYVDRDGDGWRETPDGQPLLLRFASLPDQLSRSINELWKRSLDRVGLRAVFEVSTWPELLKKTRTGALMIWGYSWSASSPDGGFFLGIAYGPNGGESNDSRFALPAFDRLYERQKLLPDGPEREALLRQGKNFLAAYMPYKVHAHIVIADLVQPGTQHYWRHPFMRDSWRFIDVDTPAVQR